MLVGESIQPTVKAKFDVFSFGLFVVDLVVEIRVFRAPELGAPSFNQLFDTVPSCSILHTSPPDVAFQMGQR